MALVSGAPEASFIRHLQREFRVCPKSEFRPGRVYPILPSEKQIVVEISPLFLLLDIGA